ncbi:MAG: FAD-binding protein [Pseudomonadota bacterium]|nr:FAD-binding protein [Pseudomonadota bacterium]
MATASLDDLGRSGDWENYHRTGRSRLKARWALRSGDAGRGRDDVAQAAAKVLAWLREGRSASVPVRPVGGAWSPSNIQTVQDGWMLNTRRFNRCFRLAPADFNPSRPVDAAAFMLVEGGVQIDEINDKLEEMGRSLTTTGASNGQTLPGACATGTHGSVLGAGGIQQHVRAMQIVTPGGIHWIEPAEGVMSDEFIRGTGSSPLRDDEVFQAALVAVGSLGIVTAMVIETEPLYLVRPFLKVIDFSRQDLEDLQRGAFQAFSDRHGPKGRDPLFVMVVTNPYRPFRKATVRLLYKFPWREDYQRHERAELGAGYDAQTMLAWAFRNLPWAPGWMIQLLMRIAVGRGITEEVYGTWGETTETHRPLADMFTGALFCDRARLVETFEKMCTAFTGAGGATAVTLRFLDGADPRRFGLLSPARWQHTASLDCDGPASERTRDAFLRMLSALEAAGIEHSCHWGKYNNLTPERVRGVYGADLARWKAVRERLLPTLADRQLFATGELRAFGLAE